jgi:putative membrane protein
MFVPEPKIKSNSPLRKWASGIGLLFWIFTLTTLFLGPQSTTYLALILVWALPPILLQLAFGADILVSHWRILTLAVLPPTLYLWLVDFLAIRWSTWTIDPVQTTGIKLGPLPAEEMLFFLITNILVVFGVTLFLSPYSSPRARKWLATAALRKAGSQEVTQRW